MTDVYNNIAASLKKYCNDFITSNSVYSSFKVYDFDAFGSESQLPDSNLIGIAEYSVQNVERMYIVTCAIVVCTKADDDAIKNLRKTVGVMFDKFQPGNTDIPIVNADTGTTIGNLVVMDDVKVFPVARTQTRPVQLIGVSFGASFLTPP